ncbi:MAG: transposase [Candidatus Enteromonas sp.]
MGDVAPFEEYRSKYPSHGYRWLNAKIRLGTGLAMSDQCAHGCRGFAGIKSRSKHHACKASGEEGRTFPNPVTASIEADRPMQVVASDMTAFWAGGTYWELALHTDLRNNEIVGYGLSCRKGDGNAHFDGPRMVAEKKKGMDGLGLILHADQGPVYSSKSFNELLPQYRVTHSMSRAGTPTDNGAMEAINGWAKAEMFADFDVSHCQGVPSFAESYVRFFNEERPSGASGYPTPKAYRELSEAGKTIPKKPSRIRYEKKQAKIREAKEDKNENQQEVSTKR